MPKPSDNLTNQEIPGYLGFGMLDPHSVRCEDDKVLFEYWVGKDLVYEIILREDSCMIVEHFEGENAGMSQYKTLEEAFTYHLISIPLHKNKRFISLCKRITKNRNIYVQLTGEGGRQSVYYPAGYLFVLRQPIATCNQAAWDALKEKIKNEDQDFPLQLSGESNGVMLRLLKSGKVDVENIIVGDCGAMLLDLEDAVNLIWESGVVPDEKEYRLSVMEISQSVANGIQICPGAPGSKISAFSVCITDNMKMSVDQLRAIFADQTRNFHMNL